jgi:hypothetical protein
MKVKWKEDGLQAIMRKEAITTVEGEVIMLVEATVMLVAAIILVVEGTGERVLTSAPTVVKGVTGRVIVPVQDSALDVGERAICRGSVANRGGKIWREYQLLKIIQGSRLMMKILENIMLIWLNTF